MKRHQDRHAARRRLARAQCDQWQGRTRRRWSPAVDVLTGRDVGNRWPSPPQAVINEMFIVARDRMPEHEIFDDSVAAVMRTIADTDVAVIGDPARPGVFFISVDPAHAAEPPHRHVAIDVGERGVTAVARIGGGRGSGKTVDAIQRMARALARSEIAKR